MVRYVMAKDIAHKYATRADTVHRWARQGLLPCERTVWANRGGEHAWEKDAFLDWEPPYRGYRKRMRIWESRDWGDGTDPERGTSSVDISHTPASEGLDASGAMDISEGSSSEAMDTELLTPSEAARRLADMHGVTGRTGRNWIAARPELLRTTPPGRVGIPASALALVERPSTGRPRLKRS